MSYEIKIFINIVYNLIINKRYISESRNFGHQDFRNVGHKIFGILLIGGILVTIFYWIYN